MGDAMTIQSHSEFKFEDEPSIIAASKIVIDGGCMNRRVVLRKVGDEYITHYENVMLDGDTWKHNGFYEGHYFKSQREAANDFEDRRQKL
jgi:hypothetical protein